MVKKWVKMFMSNRRKNMVYYMKYEWTWSMNFFCWMETINMLDINEECWEKVFICNQLENDVINIR